MALAEKLYELRKKNHLSQEQLAEQLGVSRQAVSKWETGQSVPESDKILSISRYFGVSLDFLMKDETAVPPEDPASPEPAAEETGSDKPAKHDRKTLGLAACIGGIAGLILWGVLSIFAPSASDSIAESSVIQIDGGGILILLCLAAIVSGAFLILKNTKTK